MKKWMWLWIILGIVILLIGIFYFLMPRFCEDFKWRDKVNNKPNEITNFEECIAAGNPAMESYPRQCRDSITDRIFTEDIEDLPKVNDQLN